MSKERILEIVRFGVFGILTTLVNWVIYTLLVSFSVDMTAANAVAWVGAVVFAFVTNKLFVYRAGKENWIREGVLFLLSRALTGVVEIFLPLLLVTCGVSGTLFGIEGAVAKAITTAVCLIVNYLSGKIVVFRRK